MATKRDPSEKKTAKKKAPAASKSPAATKRQEVTEPAAAITSRTNETEKHVDDGSVRHRQIAMEAYYLAEQRGFAAGHEAEDWIAAEAIVRNRGV